eukprot:maker-scaffold_2-snap-gene-27.1-mRNA-1 protein AED:0.05 eAED:0.05 QI:248/1/1/1/1/1/4/39/190
MSLVENVGNIKIVLVGDGSIGKTCCLKAYIDRDNGYKEYMKNYTPTVLESFAARVPLPGDQTITVDFWDTAGQETLADVRLLAYPDTSVFLICYSIVSRDSLDNVKATWFPETKSNAPQASSILVGLKNDLRHKSSSVVVEEEEVVKTRKEIKAREQLLCSAKTGEGIIELFKTAVVQALTPDEPCCPLL